ncbi:MAG: nucleoside phosphorylase [Anaerolineales bacterium]|jgi:uridine phosphorylase
MEKPERQGSHEKHNPVEYTTLHPQIPFTASDLPIDDEGRIYHLRAKPGQIAPDILLVGDPGRAEFIGSNFMRDIEFEHENRGLVTITGTSTITGNQATIISPLKTTVATSGIGTPSLEIVVSELIALNEVDFETRTRKSEFPRLHIIRVGTSGGLQASTKLGTPIITTYAIGMDNTGLFYEAPYPDDTCARLEKELSQVVKESMSKESRFYGNIQPYVSRAQPILVNALLEASTNLGVFAKAGLTVSNPGFSAPQGRNNFRVPPSIPEVDKIFSEYDPMVDGQCIENMEMEASFLLHFLGGMGYWAGAICPAIANRREETFDVHYHESIKNATKVALLALATIRNRYQDVRIS